MDTKTKSIYKILLSIVLLMPLYMYGQNAHDTVRISIDPSFGGLEIAKEKWYVTGQKDSVQFKKIRFYLTQFVLKTKDGVAHNVANSNNLIDVFDPKTLAIVLPFRHTSAIESISFNIGTLEEMNTAGALSGDLDPSKGMYWSWQSGYINMKIEGKSPSCETRKNKFMFHIGGYTAPYQTVQNVSYNIKGNNARLFIDFARFFENVQLSEINQIMIPGEEAKTMANRLPQLIAVDE